MSDQGAPTRRFRWRRQNDEAGEHTHDPRRTRRLGLDAEALVERTLRRDGWTILGRNVRIERDEVDLLAWDPAASILVIVEVKEAPDETTGRARLTPAKRRRLLRARRRLARALHRPGPIRLDFVVVVEQRIAVHLRGIARSTRPIQV